MRLRIHSGLLAAALALVAAAGCATTPDGGKDKNKKYTTVCADEAPTGSHIARLRCHREVDIEERRQRDRQKMEEVQFETARPKDISRPGGAQLVFGGGSLTSAPRPDRAASR